jgi:hypothetical protein
MVKSEVQKSTCANILGRKEYFINRYGVETDQEDVFKK